MTSGDTPRDQFGPTIPTSGWISHDSAFVEVQARVVELPFTIVAGLAEICTVGADGGTTVKSATLKHFGFDFSEGTAGSFETGDVPNSDGRTIGWSPEPTVWTMGDGNSVWWHSGANTATTNYSKDFGAVSLDSVTAIPTTWDGTTDASLPPLAVNHVYVVKCIDGYAKFLVKAVRADAAAAPVWEADVDYVFTSGDSF